MSNAGEIGELVEVDPAALRFHHAVIADHDEVDGQTGGFERGAEFADQGVHAERGGPGLMRIGPELVTLVVGLGEVDGDEMRTVGGGQMEQRQRIVDARLLGLGRGLGFGIEGGVVRRAGSRRSWPRTPTQRRHAVRMPWLSARLHKGTPLYQEPSVTAFGSYME